MEVDRAFLCLGLAVVVAFTVPAFGGPPASATTAPDRSGDAQAPVVHGLLVAI